MRIAQRLDLDIPPGREKIFADGIADRCLPDAKAVSQNLATNMIANQGYGLGV